MPQKPVIILFNGFGSSKKWWEYDFKDTTLTKLNFLKELRRIGDTYTFNLTCFNINNYYTPTSTKEKKQYKKLDEKVRPHTNNLNFTLEDLDFKTICNNVYTDVIKKYGSKRKFIIIGHSYGSVLSILFSKLYASKCILCVCIDGFAYELKYIKNVVNRENKKNININQLQEFLSALKNNISSKKKNITITKIYDIISYQFAQHALKYYDPVLHVKTLFFRSYASENNLKKLNGSRRNKTSYEEKQSLKKYNNISMFKYILLLDAPHFVWYEQEYSNIMIDNIKYMIK
jgi:pimeloyl-ACP methyl ester carboxylesterase